MKFCGRIYTHDIRVMVSCINCIFVGLLWGYNDELPCNSLPRPDECGAAADETDIFGADEDEEDEGECFAINMIH